MEQNENRESKEDYKTNGEENVEEDEDDDDYEEEVDGEENDDDEEDDLEDNLIDAEELNNYRRMQEMSSKIGGIDRTKKNKSESAMLTESMSQESLGSEEEAALDLAPLGDNQTDEKQQQRKSIPLQSDEGENQLMKKFSQIKSFQTTSSQGRPKYVISADKFAKFESDLFELLGIENTPFKPVVGPSSTIESQQLNCDSIRSKLVPDITRLEASLDLNPMGQIQLLKKMTTRSASKSSSSSKTKGDGAKKKTTTIVEDRSNEDRNNHDEMRSKVITVVLNQASSTTRPRKSGRILLTKKNSTSLDSVLSEIGNIFKAVESLPIRRLFNLRGNQVTELTDLFNSDDVFLAFTSDKVHNRDFEFNREELELLFAQEFMKTYSHATPESLANSLSRKSISTHQGKKKAKISDSKLDKYSGQDLESLPKELLDNYEIGPVIGEGNYALVRECKDLNTGIKFALKIIDMKKCKGKEDMIENELKILRKSIHPNIIKLVEDYRTDEFVYMVLEFYKGGDLLEALAKRGGKYTELETSQIVHCLASAIAYLHSINIVHRDLKLENIFIQQHADNSISLKLGDFGLATVCTEPLTQKCGSPIYVAPEILLEKSYRFEVDVWSLGIITYVLLCGYAPFQGETDEETFNMIKSQELMFSDQEWAHISPEVKELIRKMLNRNQAERIRASDVVEFKWPVLSNRNQTTTGRKKSTHKFKLAKQSQRPI